MTWKATLRLCYHDHYLLLLFVIVIVICYHDRYYSYCGHCRSKQGKASKPAALSRSEQEASKRREQMAVAAEARMARLKLASQQQQLWS